MDKNTKDFLALAENEFRLDYELIRVEMRATDHM